MRNTVIALALGLSSFSTLAISLPQQLDQMDQGAKGALDTRLFSHDGVEIQAWIDGKPVIIAVPIRDEQGKPEGESRYYFKGGKLFGVKEPAARFGFDPQGNLTQWLDAEGKPAEFIGKLSMQQRQHWLTARATELRELFAPSPAEQQAMKGEIKLEGAKLAHRLCDSKLMVLAGGDKVRFEQEKLKVSERGMAGEVSLRQDKGWQDIRLGCEVRGPRVVRLSWQPLPAGGGQ